MDGHVVAVDPIALAGYFPIKSLYGRSVLRLVMSVQRYAASPNGASVSFEHPDRQAQVVRGVTQRRRLVARDCSGSSSEQGTLCDRRLVAVSWGPTRETACAIRRRASSAVASSAGFEVRCMAFTGSMLRISTRFSAVASGSQIRTCGRRCRTAHWRKIAVAFPNVSRTRHMAALSPDFHKGGLWPTE